MRSENIFGDFGSKVADFGNLSIVLNVEDDQTLYFGHVSEKLS